MKKQKIPILLKLKRFKNSPAILRLNDKLSFLKPPKKFKGIPKSILLIRNDRIGDAVVTLPVIRNIKRNYPEIKIDVLVSEKNKFILDNTEYIDNVIELDRNPGKSNALFNIPVLGGMIEFIAQWVIRFLHDSEFRRTIKYLREKKYDAVVDLVGLKRNILLAKYLSRYSVGPRKFGVYIFYTFYGDTNWVTLSDDDFMTKKIERLMTDTFGFEFAITDSTLPLVKFDQQDITPAYDVIIHLGTTPLRKMSRQKEEQLIGMFKGRKVLVTDPDSQENYKYLNDIFRDNNEIEFKLFDSLEEMAQHCLNSKLLICYDGGQAHYLSQFIRTAAIFGPGSVSLWKPFEFAQYELLEKSVSGEEAIISNGKFRHIAFYLPMWCRPCFDVGCSEVVCLRDMSVSFIYSIITKYCLNESLNDQNDK